MVYLGSSPDPAWDPDSPYCSHRAELAAAGAVDSAGNPVTVGGGAAEAENREDVVMNDDDSLFSGPVPSSPASDEDSLFGSTRVPRSPASDEDILFGDPWVPRSPTPVDGDSFSGGSVPSSPPLPAVPAGQSSLAAAPSSPVSDADIPTPPAVPPKAVRVHAKAPSRTGSGISVSTGEKDALAKHTAPSTADPAVAEDVAAKRTELPRYDLVAAKRWQLALKAIAEVEAEGDALAARAKSSSPVARAYSSSSVSPADSSSSAGQAKSLSSAKQAKSWSIATEAKSCSSAAAVVPKMAPKSHPTAKKASTAKTKSSSAPQSKSRPAAVAPEVAPEPWPAEEDLLAELNATEASIAHEAPSSAAVKAPKVADEGVHKRGPTNKKRSTKSTTKAKQKSSTEKQSRAELEAAKPSTAPALSLPTAVTAPVVRKPNLSLTDKLRFASTAAEDDEALLDEEGMLDKMNYMDAELEGATPVEWTPKWKRKEPEDSDTKKKEKGLAQYQTPEERAHANATTRHFVRKRKRQPEWVTQGTGGTGGRHEHVPWCPPPPEWKNSADAEAEGDDDIDITFETVLADEKKGEAAGQEQTREAAESGSVRVEENKGAGSQQVSKVAAAPSRSAEMGSAHSPSAKMAPAPSESGEINAAASQSITKKSSRAKRKLDESAAGSTVSKQPCERPAKRQAAEKVVLSEDVIIETVAKTTAGSAAETSTEKTTGKMTEKTTEKRTGKTKGPVVVINLTGDPPTPPAVPEPLPASAANPPAPNDSGHAMNHCANAMIGIEFHSAPVILPAKQQAPMNAPAAVAAPKTVTGALAPPVASTKPVGAPREIPAGHVPPWDMRATPGNPMAGVAWPIAPTTGVGLLGDGIKDMGEYEVPKDMLDGLDDAFKASSLTAPPARPHAGPRPFAPGNPVPGATIPSFAGSFVPSHGAPVTSPLASPVVRPFVGVSAAPRAANLAMAPQALQATYAPRPAAPSAGVPPSAPQRMPTLGQLQAAGIPITTAHSRYRAPKEYKVANKWYGPGP